MASSGWQKRLAGEHLDPKIRPLIKILNENGVKTTASCQGHAGIKSSKVQRPYVVFHPPTWDRLRVLAHSILECQRFRWKTKTGWCIRLSTFQGEILYCIEPLFLSEGDFLENPFLLRKAQEDLPIMVASLEYHFGRYYQEKFEETLKECLAFSKR